MPEPLRDASGIARDGVRAQMQLLRSYADPTSRASDFTVPLSPELGSP